MGKPSPTGPEQSSQVVSGTFTGVGVSASVLLLGMFNILAWGSINTALTTTNGSTAATVASGTGLTAGMSINSANVPPGTFASVVSGTSVTLAFPPGVTSAAVASGTDAAALFMTAAVDATVQVERSFDGGSTFLICNVGGGGQLAQYQDFQSVSVTASEPERGIFYRLKCTEYTSGTILFRISAGDYDTAIGFPGT